MDQPSAYERNSPHDGCADPQAPICVLIEPEDLPGKRHSQSAQKENAATDPRQLTRVFVSLKQERLDQMQAHDGDHEDRPPVVDRAKEPPQKLFIIEVLQAGPSLACRRHVDKSQASARHDLQVNGTKGAVLTNVEPAIDSGWNFGT